jgi:hypothetical protein
VGVGSVGAGALPPRPLLALLADFRGLRVPRSDFLGLRCRRGFIALCSSARACGSALAPARAMLPSRATPVPEIAAALRTPMESIEISETTSIALMTWKQRLRGILPFW